MLVKDQLRIGLLEAAYRADIDAVRAALQQGADVNAADEATGLTALHIATGSNNLPLVKFLVEECGAAFTLDKFGRWPTTVAAECYAGEALCDYIVEKEAAAIEGAK